MNKIVNVTGIAVFLVFFLGTLSAFSLERKGNAVDQYYQIERGLLKPAYLARGAERERLFRETIEAYTDLIGDFKEKKHVTVRALAQVQIAECYANLNDAVKAREAYEKCLGYETYMKKPPRDAGDTELYAVIQYAKKKLGRGGS